MTVVKFEQWVLFYTDQSTSLPDDCTHNSWWDVPFKERLRILQIAQENKQ